MDFVFWIILLVVIAAVVWWWLNRKNSSAAQGSTSQAEGARAEAVTRPNGAAEAGGAARTGGALADGNAAPSAGASATTGMAGIAGSGTGTGAGTGTRAESGAESRSAAPTAADEPAETRATPAQTTDASPGTSRTGATAMNAGSGSGAAATDERRVQDEAEWETQWSEAGPVQAHEGVTQREGAVPASATPSPVQAEPTGQAPVHNPEYTEPHAPTLPGAETAASEDAEDAGPGTALPVAAAHAGGPEEADRPANPDESVGHPTAAAGVRVPRDAAVTETRDRAQSSALVETGTDRTQAASGGTAQATPEPAGHLAAKEPYGQGSASAAADGSGPADYTVKGDAGTMVYYEEGHPEYEQARAEVWFGSAAHAEAAGFRAPRRRRL